MEMLMNVHDASVHDIHIQLGAEILCNRLNELRHLLGLLLRRLESYLRLPEKMGDQIVHVCHKTSKHVSVLDDPLSLFSNSDQIGNNAAGLDLFHIEPKIVGMRVPLTCWRNL